MVNHDFTFNSPPPPPPPPSIPPASPTPIALTPPAYTYEPAYDDYLFMTNYDGKRLAILDFSTNKVVANIPLGGHPKRIAFTPDSRKAYVTCYFDGPEPYTGICVVDLTQNEQVAVIKLLYGGDADGVVFSADGKVAYIVSGSFMAPGRGIWTYDTSTYRPLDYLSPAYGYRIFWSADG
ncbi:MAG TPA: hypothetical protein VLT35_01490, partial [Methanocella sp.]|nr:hypothetical protein [Methanocella sp.]